jgi:GNAT superfamily N-acetyltransferase
LYELGTQGHLEDIAIASDMQGKKFGVKLIQALDHIAKEVGCYKVVNSLIIASVLAKIHHRQSWIALHRMHLFMRSAAMRKPDKRCITTLTPRLRNSLFD